MSYHLEIARMLAARGCDYHLLGEHIPPGHEVLMPLAQEACQQPFHGRNNMSPETHQPCTTLAAALAQMENAILATGCGTATALATVWNDLKARVHGTLETVDAERADRLNAQSMAFDQGIETAHAGVSEVAAGFDDLPFDGCPPSWGAKPFARICWFQDSGDRSVGIPPLSGWTLAADQTGTVVAELADLALEEEDLPTPAQVLADRSASRWLLAAIRDGLDRDPVDVANDARILAGVFRRRADSVLSAAQQALGAELPGPHA